jgi:hypothetical protein
VNVRAIITSAYTPIVHPVGVRMYDAGTEQVAERVIGPTPIPQRREAVKQSEFSGEVGPREKVRYVVEPEDRGEIPGRLLRMANTIIGATFFAPKGSRRRAVEAQAGFRMESRPRFTAVNRYPRPSRRPGVYGGS